MRDPMFAQRYFVGRAIDIGSGSDPLSRQLGYWPLLESVDEWDLAEGDAQELPGVANDTYDLVISSHCLEHVREADVTLCRWWEVLKPGGHMVVTVPDWDMYEHRQWPSRFNDDHKSTFDFRRTTELVHMLPCEAIKVERVVEHFDPSLPKDQDQTQGLAECCIELIVRKPE